MHYKNDNTFGDDEFAMRQCVEVVQYATPPVLCVSHCPEIALLKKSWKIIPIQGKNGCIVTKIMRKCANNSNNSKFSSFFTV
jgi:hypothetical protein